MKDLQNRTVLEFRDPSPGTAQDDGGSNSRRRAGQIPLWMMGCLFGLLIVALVWSTVAGTSNKSSDGRTEIVAWGITFFGDEVYGLVHKFEQQNPQYKVIISASAERDSTSDSQRLLCAIAGGVPPDVVFFSRFATGEWASRGALTDLTPFIAAQDPNDPSRLDLGEYYGFAVAEASYKPPGSSGKGRLYGIPTTGDIRILYANADILKSEGFVDAAGNARVPKTWSELREYANRLTIYNRPGDKSSGIRRLGFAPNFGNSWLYLYAWQAGGELLSADRTKVTMDSPPVVRALRFMTDIYDDLGGVKQVDAFQAALAGESVGGSFRANPFGSGDLDPFLSGKVVMKIDNDYALRTIADWKPDMNFLLAPAPMPDDRLAAGARPVTWAGGFSLVIPQTSRNKEGAFKLIKFLTSWESTRLLEQGKRERKQSEGRMYLPEGLANRVYFERLVNEAIFQNDRVPKNFKAAYTVLKELMPHTLYRPVTPVGQALWNEHVQAYQMAVNHAYARDAKSAGVDEIKYTLARHQIKVQERLDEILAPPPPHVVKWWPYLFGYALVIAAPFVVMYFAYMRRRREYGYRAREIGAAMLFLSPWTIGFAVFVGGPIVFSILFSFTRYDVLTPARYVGWENFRRALGDPLIWQSLWNTAYMIIRVPIGMAISLGIALMLNRAVRALGFYRTAFYMPAIVPLVAASLLWQWMLNPLDGVINALLTPVLRIFGAAPPLWLADASWSKPALILMSCWTAGAGMIIWLAGLQSIPPQLYEAASIDGAGAWRRFTHITLPMLSPYILFNLIIGLIATLQIWAEAYIITAGGPVNSTLFYAYELFREAFQYLRMGYASALAWILFLIVLALTLLQLWSSKKWVHYEQA